MNHLETYWLIYLSIYLMGFGFFGGFLIQLKRNKHWTIKRFSWWIISPQIIAWPITVLLILAFAIKEYRAVRKLHKREFRR